MGNYDSSWRDFNPDGVKTPMEREAGQTRREARVRNYHPVVVDGHLFQSQHEADRYAELRLEERAGTITDLQLQFPFPLEVNGLLIGHWRADFTYTRDGHAVVEDAKGFRTEMFRWKAKHFEAQYGIRIQEL